MGDFSHREFKRFLLEKEGIEVGESKKSTTGQSFHRKFKPVSYTHLTLPTNREV